MASVAKRWVSPVNAGYPSVFDLDMLPSSPVLQCCPIRYARLAETVLSF